MAEGDITFSNQFKAWLLGGLVDLDTDTIKVALVNGYSFNADNNHGYANFSANEVSATGYSAGGATLTGLTITMCDSPPIGRCLPARVGIPTVITASGRCGRLNASRVYGRQSPGKRRSITRARFR